jgi:excisionase family DNA binding protein
MIEAVPSKHPQRPLPALLGSKGASRARVAGVHPSERLGLGGAASFGTTAQKIEAARQWAAGEAGDPVGVEQTYSLVARNSRSLPYRPERSGSLEQFFTVKEVAEICRVSTKTVHRWIDRGQLVKHRFGRQLRIASTDLEVFVKLRRKP